MTKTKHLISLLFFSLFCVHLSSQTIDKYAQDGKVIFQFKIEHKKEIPMIDDRFIDHNSLKFLSKITDHYEIASVYYLHPEIKDDKLINTVEIKFKKTHKVNKLISYLEDFDFVDYAEPKALHYPLFTPDDEYFSEEDQWNLFKINSEEAWSIHTGSSDIIVAVPDDAIKTDHPDLENKFVNGWDVTEEIPDPNPAGAVSGYHGTMVSGTVGAETNNEIGIASIGFDVSIMPIKIARNSDGALSGAYDGIMWAAQNDADVINISWGGAQGGNYGQNVCNYAWNQGSILVAGAGNDNDSTEFFPAAFDNVIAVAGTGSDDSKVSNSQFGTWVDICAPGANIRSCNHNDTYSTLTGTSMSSPHVAGLIGLMKSANPSMPNSSIINCIYSTADSIYEQNLDFIGQLGHGRINAHKAMVCVTEYYDAGIKKIINPSGGSCNNIIEPRVILHNYGSLEFSTVTINYKINEGELHTYEWTGSLTEGDSDTINLPEINSPFGHNILKVFTSNPNGEEDLIPNNDKKTIHFGIFEVGLDIPWSEDFESGNLNENLWSVINLDEGITWEIHEISGTEPGNKAAGIKLYNYQTVGERNALITPPLNLTGYEIAELSFEHAYVQSDESVTDSLIIYISDDCGETFYRIFEAGEDGTGSFSTAEISWQEFIPEQEQDWCLEGTTGTECFTVDISEFTENENVMIKFEVYNNNGNNFFIDNINIEGELISNVESDKEVYFEIYPNPSAGNFSIKLTDNKSKHNIIVISDIQGKTVKSIKTEKDYINFDLSGYSKGLYYIKVFNTKGGGKVKKIVLE